MSFLKNEEKTSRKKYGEMFSYQFVAHIPKISPGLIQLHKGFGWTYKQRGLYPGGLISRIKKCFVTSHSSVDGKVFNLLIFN